MGVLRVWEAATVVSECDFSAHEPPPIALAYLNFRLLPLFLSILWDGVVDVV